MLFVCWYRYWCGVPCMVLAYCLLRFTKSTGGFKPKRAGRQAMSCRAVPCDATWVRNTKRVHGMTK